MDFLNKACSLLARDTMTAIASNLDWCIIDYRDGRRDVIKLQMAADGGERWKEAAWWLQECGVMENVQRFMESASGIVEFAQSLRDGVVLCRLANYIIPGSVQENEIKVRNVSQFCCYKNICVFLGACHSAFGIHEEHLFEATELFNLTDFAKVLHTLSLLSYTEKARERAKPFPANSVEVFSSFIQEAGVSEDCEDIYKSLQEEAGADVHDANIYDEGFYRNLEDRHQIYDSIVCQRRDSQRKKDDEWARFQPKTAREHAIKELLDTEQNYVDKALNMIIDKFHAPLQNVMSADEHRAVFMNITTLKNLHHKFYTALRAAVLHTLGLDTHDPRPSAVAKDIGEVFVLHKDNFIAYGSYVRGMDASRAKLNEFMKDSTMRQKIEDCAATANNNEFKLQDLLCLPMQRLLKYSLLLGAIIKNTPIDAPDRKSLEDAKAAILDVNNYVNEMKRDHETEVLVKDIEASISQLDMPSGTSLITYGRIRKDGEVKLCEVTKENSGSPRFRNRHVFLFDKVLLICKGLRNNNFAFKSAYLLQELVPEELDNLGPSTLGGTITRRFNGSSHYLTLRNKEASEDSSESVKLIHMSFKNLPAMHSWREQIEEAKDNVHPKHKSGHSLRLTSCQTEVATKCPACQLLMKGLFYQGYKCDTCEDVLHKECISILRCRGKRRHTVTTAENFSSLRTNRVVSGDRVVALASCRPSNQSFLVFDKDDLIDVLQVNSDSVFVGQVAGRPDSGLVRSDAVRRCRAQSTVLDSPLGRLDVGGPGRIDRVRSTVLPRPLSRVNTPAGQPIVQDYVNTEIAHQPWYFGDVERQDAEKKLRFTSNGTFLVRFSPNRKTYAISVSYENDVKHMVINQSGNQYYLDEGYVFNSIVELVGYYKDNSLIESFNTLNTTLQHCYTKCKVFRVIHKYTAPENKYLDLEIGQIVTLVDTIGEDRGWWKGKLNNKVGFFPMSYVEPLTDSEDDN